ncbi:YqaJ viral recombinase family protein [Bradyrhizobium liaoningense]|nr:YqaJ viral recombinase family protein [Bradyrhizobium liaoningense]MBR0879661.1 YqaJ viral recombinase family protein [Bradyrhizobium liaoningense]
MLSAEYSEYRRDKFTGSLAGKVMTVTDPVILNRVARQKGGLEPPDPETYAMRIGTHNEPFVRAEHEQDCGHPITRVGEIVNLPARYGFPGCVLLDGYRAFDDTVCEYKFLSSWSKREDYFPYHYWQVLWEMLCTGASRGALIVAQGTSPPIENEVIYDQPCAEALLERAAAFMLCVKTGTPPCPLPPIVPPDRMRVIDLTKEPTNWGDELLAYLTQYSATKKFHEIHEEAGKAIRLLIPDDVNRVRAGRWNLNRDKRGAIRITANNQEMAA